jgi:hypothetical protein
MQLEEARRVARDARDLAQPGVEQARLAHDARPRALDRRRGRLVAQLLDAQRLRAAQDQNDRQRDVRENLAAQAQAHDRKSAAGGRRAVYRALL